MEQTTVMFIIIFFHCVNCLFGQGLEYEKDLDIQDALIGISKRLNRRCPVVLVYDEEMPELSMSYIFVKRMQKHGRQFIMLNLSSDKLQALSDVYGSTSPSEIIKALLHILYRKRNCYTFLIWVKDPRILYPEIDTKYHPGWRRSDSVIIVSQHITKRYRTFINLQIWNHIPNIIALKRSKDGLGINIFTVLPYFRNGKRKPEELDVWLTHEKAFVHNTSLFFEKFENLHTAPIVLGVLWKEPFFIWGNKKDPYLDGLDWRIFQMCKEHLNFTFTILSPNTTGRRLGNDDWSGMMGMLANRYIDVGLGGVEVTSDRLQDFGFCRTYYTDSYNFIVPLNHQIKTAANTFFRPLRPEVWVCILIHGLVGIITLTAVAYLELRFTVQEATERNSISDRHFTSAFNNCGFIITSLCQKPYRRLPQSLAMQFTYYGISFTLFIIGMAFSSCLISVIFNFKPEPLANDVEDILKLRLPIAIREYDGHLNEFMQSSGNPTLKAIYSKADLVNYYESFDAMDDVVKGKRIYIDSKAKIHFTGRYRYTGAKGLKFHISSGKVLEFANLGWPVQKNWPLTPKLDSIISRAVESGLVKYWMSQFMEGQFGKDDAAWEITGFELDAKTEGAQDVDPSEDLHGGFVSLSRNHIRGVISLYILGVCVSIFTFIIECTAALLVKLWILLCYCYGWCKGRSNDVTVVNTSSVSSQAMLNSGFLQKNIILIRNKRKVFKISAQLEMKNLEKKHIKNPEYPELIWNDFIKSK